MRVKTFALICWGIFAGGWAFDVWTTLTLIPRGYVETNSFWKNNLGPTLYLVPFVILAIIGIVHIFAGFANLRLAK